MALSREQKVDEKVQAWLRSLAQRVENQRAGYTAHTNFTQVDVDQLRETADWFDIYDERVADGSVETEDD